MAEPQNVSRPKFHQPRSDDSAHRPPCLGQSDSQRPHDGHGRRTLFGDMWCGPHAGADAGAGDPLGLSSTSRSLCKKFPDRYLANVFWNIHVLHHPDHSPARMENDLNYKWLQNTFSNETSQLFWAHFDEQASEQELNYRVDQQAAKKTGKGKTKHFRLALPIHNLVQAFENKLLQEWNFQVSEAATKASQIFCCYMDDVFARLDLLRKVKPQAEATPDAPPQKMPQAKSSLETYLREVLRASLENTLPMSEMNIVIQMASAICVSQKAPVMRHSDVHHMKAVIALNLSSDRLNQNSPVAFRLLHL